MKSPELKPQFVTDERGARVAVLLSMTEYDAIMEILEDLADATVMEERRTERGIPHAEAMQLVREGREIPD